MKWMCFLLSAMTLTGCATAGNPNGYGSGFSCGGKTKCGQMTSCAEAQYYLQQCGLRRLDRDGDGVPCESMCR
ncbi:excalibur calcium-binding domain-containing protein [Methylococcus mesophilus]|uniref:excalibur calcium-binding domain-containing protein n=1 Tax=Methylococcus mesophilus TaxID=2993564 RepID=UPI0037441FE7